MKTINTKWLWVLGAMLLLNLALLLTLLLGQKEGRQAGPSPYLEETLNFDQHQRQEFQELRTAHHQKMRALNEQVRALKDQLFENLAIENAPVDSLTKEIGQRVAEIDKITFEHFSQVRELCNEEQKQIFDEKILSVIKQGRPDGPGAGRPPRGERGGPPHQMPPPPPH